MQLAGLQFCSAFKDARHSSAVFMDAAVHTFLQEADLQEFAEPLHNLGVQKLEDLKDLETDDFQEIGMKKLQKRRFDRALESKFGNGVPVNEPDPKRQRVSAPEKPVARPTIATSSASRLEQAMGFKWDNYLQ